MNDWWLACTVVVVVVVIVVALRYLHPPLQDLSICSPRVDKGCLFAHKGTQDKKQTNKKKTSISSTHGINCEIILKRVRRILVPTN